MIKHSLERQGYVDIPANGQSMYPLIRQGHICRFGRVDKADLRRGDILLFMTNEGVLVGHRYLYDSLLRGTRLYVCKGDSNRHPDHPVPLEQIIGKLMWIKTSHMMVMVNNRWVSMWGKALIKVPRLSGVIAMYLRWKRSK